MSKIETDGVNQSCLRSSSDEPDNNVYQQTQRDDVYLLSMNSKFRGNVLIGRQSSKYKII